MNLLSNLRFGKLHVFPFSVRRGTEAAGMKNSVPGDVRKERTGAALMLSEELLAKYAESFAGRNITVLAEDVHNGVVSGWSRNYLRVYSLCSDEINGIIGREAELKPIRAFKGALFCEGVDPDGFVGFHDDI